ncbi:MAG: peptidase M28 family protein [Cytophagales bacterium]|nr:MAG: peptidase M28 family protein [Cytophagales bacterium]
MKNKYTYLCLCFSFVFSFLSSNNIFAQDNDALLIRQIYDETLTKGQAYSQLEYLCKKIGGRLSGSPAAAAAVEFTRYVMDSMKLDNVYLQPVMVPHWVRGQKEVGKILNSRKIGSKDIEVCALGNSVGTGKGGITANLLEVKNFDELKALGKEKVEGKIIFFNRPMDATKFNTFEAYGGAANQRGSGASEAAKLGAIGVIVRSLASNIDDILHTGSTNYQLNVPKIPAVAISTKNAEFLSSLLKSDSTVSFYFETHCQMLPDILSYNVIGEIKGSEKPEEIIVVGGHLDSWDLGEGAHDDGTGCMQSIEVLRIFKALNIKPKRTIRAVMYMNEENGLRGGLEYAKVALEKKEKHIAAMESDRGGFTPREFTTEADEKTLKKMQKWATLFEPYGISAIKQGGGGADISPLKNQNTVLIGYVPDSQRYFDVHHTSADTFDKVSPRELALGAGAMAALAYLIAQYGL